MTYDGELTRGNGLDGSVGYGLTFGAARHEERASMRSCSSDRGRIPHSVVDFLESRLNYEQMDAAMKAATRGAVILRTRDHGQATSVAEHFRRRAAWPKRGANRSMAEGLLRPTSLSQEFETCPDRAEDVRAAARKCRFCGHMFENGTEP
jgi:hypothetical protein